MKKPFPLYSHAKYSTEIPEENSESEQSDNEELDTVIPVTETNDDFSIYNNGDFYTASVPFPGKEAISEDEDDVQCTTYSMSWSK